MPIFQYTVLDSTGTERTGTIKADFQYNLRRRLQEQGFQVQHIREISRTPERWERVARLRVRQSDTLPFWILVSQMLDTNVPMVQALQVAVEETRNRRLRTVLQEMRANIGGGETLSVAMRRYPRVFSPMAVGMIRAGEVGGALAEAIHRLLAFQEREAERQRALRFNQLFLLLGSVIVALLVILVCRVR